MFGDFNQAFGLASLNFPFQGTDVQGGLFGQNAPGSELIGSTPMGPTEPVKPPAMAAAGPSTAGTGSAASPLANPSPLAPANAAGPQAAQPPKPQGPTAPAAGQGSPFGAQEL